MTYESIPFHPNPAICTTGANGRPTPHARYYVMDADNKLAKQVRQLARKSARAKAVSDQNEARNALLTLCQRLDTGTLNFLAVVLMIAPNWNGATGQGGVWAKASNICNTVAREALRTRPMFEVVG